MSRLTPKLLEEMRALKAELEKESASRAFWQAKAEKHIKSGEEWRSLAEKSRGALLNAQIAAEDLGLFPLDSGVYSRIVEVLALFPGEEVKP